MRARQRTDPRTVRSARKRAWQVIALPSNTLEKHKASWLGITLWVTQNIEGQYVNCFQTREFAFDSETDASKFILRWVW